MTVTELIENYSGPDTSRDVLKGFATELLELIKANTWREHSMGGSLISSDATVAIELALEELRQ